MYCIVDVCPSFKGQQSQSFTTGVFTAVVLQAFVFVCVCVRAHVCGSIDRLQAPLMQHSGKETDTCALMSQCSSMVFIGIFSDRLEQRGLI